MVANQKVTGTASSMPGGLAAGAVFSIAITNLGALVVAHLISNEIIHQDSIGYCSMAILLVASMTGTAVACKRIKHRKLMVCSLSGLIYYMVLLAATALFFGGIYEGLGVTALLVFAGSMTVALTGLKGEGSARRKRNRIQHR